VHVRGERSQVAREPWSLHDLPPGMTGAPMESVGSVAIKSITDLHQAEECVSQDVVGD